VAVEADALARLEADHPHAHPVALGQELGADAAVGALALLPEFLGEPLRPIFLLGANRLLVHHRQRHGVTLPRMHRLLAGNV
jgi:hypothetical protein